MPNIDPEFERIVSAVETLETVALEHEKKQKGPHKNLCLDNRSFIIAMAMRRLGLGVSEIGFVAEHLFDIECEDATTEEGEDDETKPDTPDDILESKELSGL